MTFRPDVVNGVPIPRALSTPDLAALTLGDGDTRWAAFAALGEREDDGSVATLVTATHAPDSTTRRAACEALATQPRSADVVARVRALLHDTDVHVVRTACAAVAAWHRLEFHARVIELLGDRDPSTRETAARALNELWLPVDFPTLLATFASDESPSVRQAAATVLLGHADASTWRRLFDTWTRDPGADLRTAACNLAARFGEVSLLPLLHPLLSDPNGHVRSAAARAIARLSAGPTPPA